MDCLVIIYHTYRSESSFGVEKDVILSNLEIYFEQESKGEMIFEDEEVATNARAQAQATLRNLEACGWIENEVVKDYKIKVNLLDYAVTMIESFQRIIANDELEYQSLISQIHATLTSERGYDKPYEYIIKSVVENTDELINGLKKLNTNIKKYIEAITADKSAGEIIDDFFNYHPRFPKNYNVVGGTTPKVLYNCDCFFVISPTRTALPGFSNASMTSNSSSNSCIV
jgi:hypothetical protein